jgi:hypothetical protein
MEKNPIGIIGISLIAILLTSSFIINAYADDITVYSHLTDTTGQCLFWTGTDSTSQQMLGEEVATSSILIGAHFDQTKITLRKIGNPNSAPVRIGIWDSTTAPTPSNYIKLIGEMDSSDVSSSATEYTFNFDGYTLQINQVVGAFFTGTGNGSNCVSVRYGAGTFDGSNTRKTLRNGGAWTDENTNDVVMKLIDRDIASVTTGIDCDLPENTNILICRLGGDGTLGSAGAFVIGNTTTGTGILGTGCSIGLVDCTADSNPQTNGLGLLIFLASLLLIVGFFYATMGTGAFSIHPFIWVMIIIVDAAFFTLTGIIDPVFLILAIIAIIALAAPRLKDVVSRGTSFGSGSTE